MTGTAASAVTLPKGVTVFERGWLSSNNILIQGPDHCALIDSGLATRFISPAIVPFHIWI